MPPQSESRSLKAIATNFSGGFIDATGLSYLLCLFASALDVAANGAPGPGVTCVTSREGRGEVLGGHRGNDGEPEIDGYY
jgi:hypothetical protein